MGRLFIGETEQYFKEAFNRNAVFAGTDNVVR